MVYITEQRAIVRLNQQMACNHDAKREKHGEKKNKTKQKKRKKADYNHLKEIYHHNQLYPEKSGMG